MTTPSTWQYFEADRTWEIYGRDCWVWVNPRPPHCDRGAWLAHVEPNGERGAAIRLSLDAQDGFPRYYFDLDRCKLEIEAWLRKRRQWVD